MNKQPDEYGDLIRDRIECELVIAAMEDEIDDLNNKIEEKDKTIRKYFTLLILTSALACLSGIITLIRRKG